MTFTDSDYWNMIHAERSRVANMLEGLSEGDWRATSLSSDWAVEQVVAHLTAAANTTLVSWLFSMLRAGFKPEKHNQRQLSKYLGDNPADTLEMFRESMANTKAPTKDYCAWLGEVIVHGQDIARPLEIRLNPDPMAVEQVAKFYAAKDFAVNSKSMASGLRLVVADSDFTIGEGPLVQAPLLELVMAMAGRPVDLQEFEGDGVEELGNRLT